MADIGIQWPPPEWQDPQVLAEADQQVLGGLPPVPTLQAEPWPPPGWPPTEEVAAADQQVLGGPANPQTMYEMRASQAQDAAAPPTAQTAPPPPLTHQLPTTQAPQAPQAPRQAQAPGRPKTYAEQVTEDTEAQKAANARMAGLEGDQANVQQRTMQAEADATKLADANAQLREERRQADLTTKWQELEKQRTDLANARIDDNQFYDDMTTGQRIGWMVAAGISGGLAVRQGRGGNDTLELMNRMVDRNLEAQKANLANRRANLDSGQSLYQQLVAQYGDERQADAMWKAAAIDNIRKQGAAEAAKYANPVIHEQWAQKDLALDMQARELVADATRAAEEAGFNRDMQRRKVGIDAYEARTGRMNAETQRLSLEASRPDPNAEPEFFVPDLDGEPIVRVNNRFDHEHARKIVTNVGQTKALYKEAKELFKDGWDKNPYSERYARQMKLAASWVNGTKTADGDFSAPNTFDMQERSVKDAWGPSHPMAELDQGYRQAKVQQAAALKVFRVPNDKLIGMGLMDPEGVEGATEAKPAPAPAGLPGQAGLAPRAAPTRGERVTDFVTGGQPAEGVPAALRPAGPVPARRIGATHDYDDRGQPRGLPGSEWRK